MFASQLFASQLFAPQLFAPQLFAPQLSAPHLTKHYVLRALDTDGSGDVDVEELAAAVNGPGGFGRLCRQLSEPITMLDFGSKGMLCLLNFSSPPVRLLPTTVVRLLSATVVVRLLSTTVRPRLNCPPPPYSTNVTFRLKLTYHNLRLPVPQA